LTTLLVTAHVLVTLATAGVAGFGTRVDEATWFHAVACVSNFFETGQWWTALTYPFYHNIVSDHIFLVLELVFFYWFGVEVERATGRGRFLFMYALMVILPPLVLTLTNRWFGIGVLHGSTLLHFGVFIAFVAACPWAQIFSVPVKWLAWILLFVCVVYMVAVHNWVQLTQLAVVVALGWRLGVGSGLGWWARLAWRWRVVSERRARLRADAKRQRERCEAANVDAVLEKISRDGLDALSVGEREILQRERKKLLARERR
jgi:membrane associated rhomboid family serine protease